MKEVKLFIDTTSLDQIQASMNRILAELAESKKSDADLIDEVDVRIDRIFDKIISQVKTAIRAEIREVVEKEFAKLLGKLLQK